MGINGKKINATRIQVKREANLRRLIAGFPLGAYACCLCVAYTHVAPAPAPDDLESILFSTLHRLFFSGEIIDESLVNAEVAARNILPVDPFSYLFIVLEVP